MSNENDDLSDLRTRYGKQLHHGASAYCHAIATYVLGGEQPINVFFNKQTRAVALHFPNCHTTDKMDQMAVAFAQTAGERLGKSILSDMVGDELVIKIPIDTYINQFGGQLSEPGSRLHIQLPTFK